MKAYFIYIITIFIMVVGCNRKQDKSPDQWSEKELKEWFNEAEWKQGWPPLPDESLDQKEFARRYSQNPERWDKAFQFLNRENLATLEPGRYELEGADLFVNVDEYITKNEADARFEAHQQYADIQYLVSGEEKIGVLPLKNTTVTTPYNAEKDIVFLTSEDENYRVATAERFFVFFPDDAHRPCVKTGDNSRVRKVVVKVRIEEN